MVIDFTKFNLNPQPTSIKGQMVKWASSYKYLGLIIDNKLRFDTHVEAVCKKGQQGLYCLRRLSTFYISRTFKTIYYKSYIESVLCYFICCWYGNVNVKHRNSLNGIVNQGSKIIGIKQTGFSFSYDQFVLQKATIIVADCTHPLFHEFKIPSGIPYSMPKLKSNRYRHLFYSHCCKAFKFVGCCVCCLFCLCFLYDMYDNKFDAAPKIALWAYNKLWT